MALITRPGRVVFATLVAAACALAAYVLAGGASAGEGAASRDGAACPACVDVPDLPGASEAAPDEPQMSLVRQRASLLVGVFAVLFAGGWTLLAVLHHRGKPRKV